MSQPGLYPEQLTFAPSRVSDERTSIERDTMRAAMDDGVEGITEARLTRAVMLVEDAIAGRKYTSKLDMTSMTRYMWYHHWLVQLAIRLVVLMHIGLAFFEVPATIKISNSVNKTIVITGLLELLILIFYTVEMFFKRSFLEVKNDSWGSNKNYWINWICIVLTAIDVILGMIFRTEYFRWSVFLRPLFVVYNFPSVRHYFKNLKNTIPDIIHVFVVLFALILFYVLCIDVLLSDYEDPSFPNTFRAFISLYITSTTANFPDIMVYSVDNVSPWYALLFVSYATLITKIMLSLFTAVVYNRYQFHISKDVEKIKKVRTMKLTAAFELLDPHKTGLLKLAEWTILLSRLRPHYTEDKIRLLFRIIDENGSETLKLREFRRIVLLLRLHITAQSTDSSIAENHIARHFPWFYRTRFFFFLKKIILSKAFGWAMDLVVVASAVRVIAFKEMSVSLTIRTVTESVLLSMYVGEAVCKLAVLGTVGYWSSNWNKFDGLLCITGIISMIITLFPGFSSQGLTRIMLLLRIFRLFRLGRTSQNIRSLYQTMWRLIPTFAMHALALLVVYFEFGMAGMAFFKGKIWRGNPLLDGSGYQSIGFYNTSNFNTFGNAILTLFELMIQNNWHVIVDAFERVTNWAVWIFFIFYNISTAVVIINILVAFILDGFITQWKVVQLQIKTKVQIRIEQLAAEGEREKAAARLTDAPLPDSDQVELDSLNAFDKVEKFLGEEEAREENVIWTASDTSFKIDPLEFIEDDEEDDE
jgi:hypothetical protein